jgi:alginate O-acetyltransferase complex protein AlgI
LVAGPIERATNLIPQFKQSRSFSYSQAKIGMQLILWGLFKKVVIADNCAIVVNQIFNNYSNASGLELVVGAVFFAFQIYGDFSGYSDMAIGTSKLFGFDLMINFKTPYFSRDMAEFWRRWHISLSTWFRDYVYIPLGGSRVNKKRAAINTFIIFLVSGFWHGANWTFIVWGGLNALYFLPLLLFKRNRTNTGTIATGRHFPSVKESIQMIVTFMLTCFAWIFFRSDSLFDAWHYIYRMFGVYNFHFWDILNYTKVIGLLFIFLLLEWRGRELLSPLVFEKKWMRRISYAVIVMLIIFYGMYVNPNSFIYFQF